MSASTSNGPTTPEPGSDPEHTEEDPGLDSSPDDPNAPAPPSGPWD